MKKKLEQKFYIDNGDIIAVQARRVKSENPVYPYYFKYHGKVGTITNSDYNMLDRSFYWVQIDKFYFRRIFGRKIGAMNEQTYKSNWKVVLRHKNAA